MTSPTVCSEPVFLAVDDTLANKRGLKMFGLLMRTLLGSGKPHQLASLKICLLAFLTAILNINCPPLKHFPETPFSTGCYSSNERATNENTNGLQRQYFPKKTDFRDISRHALAHVTARLDNRPHKRLNYLPHSKPSTKPALQFRCEFAVQLNGEKVFFVITSKLRMHDRKTIFLKLNMQTCVLSVQTEIDL
jgi:hypothetical protein